MNEKQYNLLVVEDDQVDLQAFKRLVKSKRLPYIVTFASSIKEAKRRLAEARFDLILLDYNLGDGTGIEILEEMKKTPIVFVTGSGDEETAVQAMKLGAYDYIIKDPDRNYLTVLPTTVQNVISRKWSEDALRDSEERFRSAFEYAPTGIVLCNLDFKIIQANSRFCDMVGYTESELQKMTFKDITHPDDIEMSVAQAKRMRDGETIFIQTDKRYLHKNGKTVWGTLSASVLRSADGVPQYFQGQVLDITAKKKAEENLRKSEQRNIAIIRSVGEGIVVIGSGSKILLVNEELLKIFGYASETDLLGESITTLMPEKYRALHAKKFREYMAGAPASVLGKRVELEGLKMDGTEFPLELRIEETINPDGERFFTGAIRDISDRVLAEERLRKSEERFRVITKSANDAIILLDNDGKVVFWNPAAQRVFGYSSEEMKGRDLKDFVIPDKYTEKHQSGFEVFRKTGEGPMINKTVEVSAIRKNGEVFPIDLSIAAIRLDNLWHAVGIVRDITERKQFEEELHKAKESAEEANNLKDMFVSLVAHDLRSPLTSILGLLEYINSGKNIPAKSTHEDMLGSMIKSGHNMVDMIDELLSITRLQTGRIELKRRFFDFRVAASVAVGSLRPMALNKGIELVNDIPEGTRVYGDMDLLGVVMHNLISNSIKFSNRDDKVEIYAPSGREGTFVVKDHGVGIDTGTIDNLFRREIKTSSKGTDGEKGTGLGLPFCSDIMSAHGGSIRVESVTGEGSEFYIELPVIMPSILLVDDDSISRRKMTQFISVLDADIRTAANGKEALVMIGESKPHVVLADLYMPEMDGFELISALKSDPDTRQIPVIAITAHGEMETREKAFRMGADDFVVKPTSAEELVPRVKRHIS